MTEGSGTEGEKGGKLKRSETDKEGKGLGSVMERKAASRRITCEEVTETLPRRRPRKRKICRKTRSQNCVWCQKVFMSSRRAYSCSNTCRSRIKRAGWAAADLYVWRIEQTDKAGRAEQIALRMDEISKIPLLATVVSWLLAAREAA
jgi:hypothetical protein